MGTKPGKAVVILSQMELGVKVMDNLYRNYKNNPVPVQLFCIHQLMNDAEINQVIKNVKDYEEYETCYQFQFSNLIYSEVNFVDRIENLLG